MRQEDEEYYREPSQNSSQDGTGKVIYKIKITAAYTLLQLLRWHSMLG